MRQRHETPTAFNCKVNPINKRSRDRVDSIHNPSLTEREKALQALAMMKELERKRRKKMVSVRIDERTVICAEKKRIQEIAKTYKKN